MKIKSSNTQFNIKRGGNLPVTILAAFLVIAVGIGVFFLTKPLIDLDKYYVLNQDVAAKTQIRTSMLQEVKTYKGSAPKNAISYNQVKQGTIYSKIPLRAGDVLSVSNTGLTLDTSTGIPDDWSITSFNISADNAVGGNISKGDYFDIIGVSAETGAKYLFVNALVLEVNYSRDNTKVTSDGKVIQLGEQLQYVVGMPADKIPLLHHAFAKYDTVKLALAPNSLSYKDRAINHLAKSFVAGTDTPVADLFKGTDSSFAPVLRDESGIPVNGETCAKGIISPLELCEQIPQEVKTRVEATPVPVVEEKPAEDKKDDKEKVEETEKKEETKEETQEN